LPVLDISHPDFISTVDEKRLKKLIPYVEKNAQKNAEKFNKIPGFIKNYFSRHSFTMAELLGNESSFATGISTLMMKLGPNLIGRGKKRFWDRMVSKGFGSLVIRMRARDISRCQAEALIPILKRSGDKSLCFINIAGGSASDSINTLFLIHQENPLLLKNRKIEINVLDIDTFGPAFAERCITALVDAGIVAALKISTSIKPRFLGINGLKSISERSGWKIDNMKEGNPRYLVFLLKKK